MCKAKQVFHHKCGHELRDEVTEWCAEQCKPGDPSYIYEKPKYLDKDPCERNFRCAYYGRIQITDEMHPGAADFLQTLHADTQQAQREAYKAELAKHRANNPPKAKAKHPKHPQNKHKKH